MSIPQRHNPRLWSRGLKFAVGAAVFCFFAAGMLMLPTADRKRGAERQVIAQVVALESAVNNFHVEYGVLPAVGSHLQTDGPDGVRFLNILLGSEESAPKQNPREIKFLAVREAKGRKNGLQHCETGNRVEGLFDVWGNPFVVEINVKNGDKLRFEYGRKFIELPGRLMVAYSTGKDGKPGTPDDVVSW